jgi:phosphoglycerol transferase MdoB-like AlkP superfamily enzyme
MTKAKHLLPSYMALAGCWLVVLLLIRIGDLLLNGFVHQFPTSIFRTVSVGALSDIQFFLQAISILALPFILVGFFNAKAARYFFMVITCLLTLLYLVLLGYYFNALVPLGADIYGYSKQDIIETIASSGSLNTVAIFFILLPIAVLLAIYKFVSRKINLAFTSVAFVLAIAFCSWATPAVSELTSFKSVHDHQVAINKLSFFGAASYDHFFPTLVEPDIYSDAYIGYYGEEADTKPVGLEYVDEVNYPFLHKEETADVLSPYFAIGGSKPNIVVIIVEGLGRAFHNQGAYLGSFTPFLDSLSQHSLYWENFLSNGGRTFAVLPSLLGSLPFGEHGVSDMNNLPAHLSLVGLLKHNGYNTSFFYGGKSSFDNMNRFMQHQQTDEIIDEAKFAPHLEKLPSYNGFSWGYSDEVLFNQFFIAKDRQRKNIPSLDVLLTLSTHSPFLINNADRYKAKARQRMKELAFTNEQVSARENYITQFATVMYSDECLQQFFARFRNDKSYQNTIFIITGDHRIPEIPMQTKIDRYHVPLIIYSPMLKRTAKFSSISSHVDVAPSLLSFLKNSYTVEVPELVSWIGTGLDTARGFRNIHTMPLMQTKTDLIDFVTGKYHLNAKDAFELTENLSETRVNDKEIANNLLQAFNTFNQKNQEFIQGKKLLPDSIITRFKK